MKYVHNSKQDWITRVPIWKGSTFHLLTSFRLLQGTLYTAGGHVYEWNDCNRLGKDVWTNAVLTPWKTAMK